MQDSRNLPLVSPIRGICVWNKATFEICLKVKHNDSTSDDTLVDVCTEFICDKIKRDKRLRSRIDGPFGALES